MNVLEKSKQLISEFKEKHSDKFEEIVNKGEKLREACRRIERSWSGSFAGWHGRMYFRDFQIPSIYERFSGEWGGGIHGIPEGWEEKQPEEVREKIEELVGDEFSADDFGKELEKLKKEAIQLKDEIVITLSVFNLDTQAEKEKELFSQIENFEFGKTKGEFINDRLPKTMISRDTEALRQGICIASWLYYEGVALEAKSFYEAINNFFGLVTKLVRLLEQKSKFNTKTMPTGDNRLENLHKEIYKKCFELYQKGAYAEAVEKSFKVVRDRLRKLTGYETGSEAFGKGKLHIKGAAAQNVDQDFNDAVKFLTMAIDRFRNEKSHTSDAKIDDPIRAYEYLRLSSLAMNLLEDSEILP